MAPGWRPPLSTSRWGERPILYDFILPKGLLYAPIQFLPGGAVMR